MRHFLLSIYHYFVGIMVHKRVHLYLVLRSRTGGISVLIVYLTVFDQVVYLENLVARLGI